ncbi:MAG: peptidase MA family metallohydrolase [Candidatus Limnocylindrales bacterium]
MRSGRRTPGRALVIATTLAMLAASSLVAAPVRAAEPAFGKPTIEGSLGDGLEVTQPATLDTVPDRVEVLLTYADAPGPLVAEVVAPSSSGSTTLRHSVVGSDGHIYPNTPVTVRWRITTAGVAVLGPEVKTVFADERFDWKTVSGDLVRVHWYEGGTAFGERALRIGEDAMEEASRLLGVTEDEPVDFFIYADQDPFYDALGPGTRENVGGQANAEIRTMFALIGPSAIDDPWVAIVVPHELVHLVFNTAVENPYHFPPRWLNEGLAQYLSQGYDAGSRSAVESAGRAGELIPLDGLGGQFPTSAERFGLAYSESVGAVDYLIRTHGQDALVSLIRSYADGRTDDEAFSAAIGVDVAGFNDAWLADLGAAKPTRHGPQPDPAGPLPAAWAGASGDPGSPTTAPGATAIPGSSGAPAAPAASSGAGPPSILVIVGVVLLIAVIGGILVLRRARSRREVPVPPPVVPGP